MSWRDGTWARLLAFRTLTHINNPIADGPALRRSLWIVVVLLCYNCDARLLSTDVSKTA